MFRVSYKFRFEAGHHLESAEDTRRGDPHGHEYFMEFVFGGIMLRDDNMLIPRDEVDDLEEWVHDTYDHKYLNDFVGSDPTAEDMARDGFNIWKAKFPMLRIVRVHVGNKIAAFSKMERP